MPKNLKRYTIAELRALATRGEDKTDWSRLAELTDEQLEAAIAADSDWKGVPRDWFKAAEIARPKKVLVSIRMEADVLDWFRSFGPGWQTRVNAVLRAYVAAAKGKPGA